MAQIRRREKCLFSGRPSVSACENCSSGWTRTRWFNSGLAPQIIERTAGRLNLQSRILATTGQGH